MPATRTQCVCTTDLHQRAQLGATCSTPQRSVNCNPCASTFRPLVNVSRTASSVPRMPQHAQRNRIANGSPKMENAARAVLRYLMLTRAPPTPNIVNGTPTSCLVSRRAQRPMQPNVLLCPRVVPPPMARHASRRVLSVIRSQTRVTLTLTVCGMPPLRVARLTVLF
eukprot:PhF_6_TR10394/c1_g1_i5/m.16265